MMDQETLELAELYLQGELEEKAVAQFEERLLHDPALAADVRLLKGVDQSLQDESRLDMMRRIQAVETAWFDKQEEDSKAKQRRLPTWTWAIAAMLVLGLAIWALLPGAEKPSQLALIDSAYSTFEAPGAWRSDTSPYPQGMQDAFELYEQGRFSAASSGFASYSADSTFGVVSRFYLSQCQLAAGEYDAAIASFTELAASEDHIFYEDSKWYLALAYLKAGSVAPGKDLLRELAASESSYAQQAKELIKGLE